MVYILIDEFRNPNRLEHEVRMYKYNYNHDEMVVYFKTGSELKISTFIMATPQYEKTYDLGDD